MEPLRARLLKKHGFQADMEHFAIFGVCQRCAGARARHGSKAG
jgi:Fe2+ or Zn2+ uptake regulation protein